MVGKLAPRATLEKTRDSADRPGGGLPPPLWVKGGLAVFLGIWESAVLVDRLEYSLAIEIWSSSPRPEDHGTDGPRRLAAQGEAKTKDKRRRDGPCPLQRFLTATRGP
jgi:hypothetical protein